jgi:mannan endo-1,4-beta-mannosidase
VTDLSSAGTRHILIGQHTNYWSGNPMDQTQALISQTGKTPAILGTTIGCIGSVEDGVTLSNQWLAKGGIVMVNLWATDPVTGLDDNDRNVDFGQMSTPGTPLYNTWMAYLDTIAAKLKAINGPVLFRPFVELNGNWSWFGGKDPAQFIKVYQQMHDYLVKTKGVTNLVWVYSINDGNGNYTAYYPGNDYIDIVGMDAYPAQAYTKGMYNAALTLNKPMIFAEVGVISPSPSPANDTGNNETMLQFIEGNFPAVVAVVIWSQGWSLATQNGASGVMNDQENITLADL